MSGAAYALFALVGVALIVYYVVLPFMLKAVQGVVEVAG